MKRLFVRLLVLSVMVTAVYGATRFNHYTETISLSVTTAVDSIQATKFTPSFGVDSFQYKDTFSYWNATDSTDTTAHKTVVWTSPSQKARLNIVWDTTKTYYCSLDCGTNIYGAQWVSDNDVTTAGQAIDSLVAIVNAIAGLTDTIVLEDSVSYIKVRSKIAQAGLEGDARWRIKAGPAGFLDTVTYANTTVAMACDSMVAKVNAATGLLTYVTASDSTTYYKIVSDDRGLLYYTNALDTAQDTVYLQTNVASRSASVDTFGVDQFKQMNWSAEGLYARVIIDTSVDASGKGFGLADSGYIRIYSVFGGDMWSVIAADSTATLPCTLICAKPSGLAGADTLLKGDMFVWTRVADTASDTTMSATYRVRIDYEMTIQR